MPDSWSAPVNTSSVMCESTLRIMPVRLHGRQEATRRQCFVPETVQGVIHDRHDTAGLDAVHVVTFELSTAKRVAKPPDDSAAVTPCNARCTAAEGNFDTLHANTVPVTAISHLSKIAIVRQLTN